MNCRRISFYKYFALKSTMSAGYAIRRPGLKFLLEINILFTLLMPSSFPQNGWKNAFSGFIWTQKLRCVQLRCLRYTGITFKFWSSIMDTFKNARRFVDGRSCYLRRKYLGKWFLFGKFCRAH